MIEAKNIVKRYGSLEVLRNISFSVEKGDVIAVIGSSGSGKSTLLRCLIDLEEVDGGTVTIDGTEISVSVNKRMTKRPGLCHIDQSTINGTVTVRMIFTHGITDNTGTLSVRLVRSVI